MRPVTIARPMPADATALAALWRRSITHLCYADHHGDPALVAAWTANKTAERLAAALAAPTLSWHVAREPAADTLVAVGLLGPEGAVMALYVEPAAVGQGVGSRVLAVLEAEAAAQGLAALQTESTGTARPFYHRRGFRDSGPPVSRFGLRAWPMRKPLNTQPASGATSGGAPRR